MAEILKYTQNFLHSPALVAELVARAEIPPGATVLEIGPGKGIITAQLAERVTATGRVIAVELDPALILPLNTRFAPIPQVSLLHQDILTFDLKALGTDYAVFSNVPFNITSDLLETLFTGVNPPRRAHLILQIDALIDPARDTPTETFKSLLLKPFYEIQVVHRFSPADFMPRPGVDTALFAFERRAKPHIQSAQVDLYKDFLAFISKDRVGEGVWKKAFSPKHLQALTEKEGLIQGRGLKSQTVAAVLAAFHTFATSNAKHRLVNGAMAALREEQHRREAINASGGHHRSKRSRGK